MPSLIAGSEVILFSPRWRRFVKVSGATVGTADPGKAFPDLSELMDAEAEADAKKDKLARAKDALEDARKAKASKKEKEALEKKVDKAKDAYEDADKKRDKLRKKYADLEPVRFKLVDAGGGAFNLKNADTKDFLRLADGKASSVDKVDQKSGCAFTFADAGGFTTLQTADTRLYLRMKDASGCDGVASAVDESKFQVQVSGQPLAAFASLAPAGTPTPPAPATTPSADAALIIDAGSGTTRFLRAQSGEAPVGSYPSVVGRMRNAGVMLTPTSKAVYVGEEALSKRALLNLKNPIEHGIVTGWDDATELYKYAATSSRVLTDAQPLVVTDNPINPKANRERMTSIAFDTFRVPAFYLGTDALFAMQFYGKKTGVVVSSGAGVTLVTPVIGGHVVPSAVIRLDFGGNDLTDYLKKLLTERGLTFTTSERINDLNLLKENLGYVANDFDAELATAASSGNLEKSAQLTDGQVITVNAERFRVAEVLFKPSLLGLEQAGIAQSTYDAIMKCDPDARNELYQNVVMAGGSTMFAGLSDRLTKELTKLAPPSQEVKVLAHPNRKNAVALGAAAFARAPDFASRCITAAEFASAGAAIVHTKCAL